MNRRAQYLSAALTAAACATLMAAKFEVTLTGASIPSIAANGTYTNSPSGTANFKVKFNSNTAVFVAKADKGKSTSQYPNKALIAVPFNQVFLVPSFGTVTFAGTADLEYAKPKVKKGLITDPNVKVKGVATGIGTLDEGT